MIRAALLFALCGSTASAQDWSFRIDVDQGTIVENQSGSRQAEFSAAGGPYMSAEAYAVVESADLPPCDQIAEFEIDFFFGWSDESNVHVMSTIAKSGEGSWANDEPWLILSPTATGDILTDDNTDMTFQDVTCAADNQLNIAMTVRANVTGETGTQLVKLNAQALAPIYHIDEY